MRAAAPGYRGRGLHSCSSTRIGATQFNEAELGLKKDLICFSYSDTFLQTKHKDFCVNKAFFVPHFFLQGSVVKS